MITTSALQKNTNVQQHTLAQTILFHLLPGLLITFVFIAIAGLMNQFNLPPSLALLTTWLVAGIPIELGILLHQGWRQMVDFFNWSGALPRVASISTISLDRTRSAGLGGNHFDNIYSIVGIIASGAFFVVA
jgi:hypothetical protein